MNDDDLQVIRAAKKGQIDAFSKIVRNYKNFVFRAAYGVLQNQSDAEDVTQETFIQVHTSLKDLKDERTFPTWIARIAVRKALDFTARNQKHQALPLDPDRLHSDADSHRESDLRIDFEQALRQLNQEQRTIVVLRELRGCGYEELARILQIPVGTVRSRLHNARTRLRQLLLSERGESL